MKKLYLFLIFIIITTTLQAAINVSITNPVNSRDTICQGLTQLITTNVSGITGNATYQWKKNSQILSNTGSTYLYNATSSGKDTIIVTATNSSESSSDTVIFVVKLMPVASFTISTGNYSCSGTDVFFTNNSSNGSSASWIFPGANNPSSSSWSPNTPRHWDNLTGIATIAIPCKLIITASNGCVDSVINDLTINPLPVPKFSIPFPATICKGSSVSCSMEAITGSTFLWSTAASNFSINPTNTPQVLISSTLAISTGFKTITVTETNSFGCENTNDTIIEVVSLPTPNFIFSPDNACALSNISFTNNTTNASTYRWKFGDGQTSTNTSPSHIFDTIGNGTINYSVWLIATSQYGCKDSVSHVVHVKQRPDASLKSENPGISLFENYPNSISPTLFKKCNIVPPHFLQLTNLSTTSATNTNYYIKWGNGNTYTSIGSNFGIPNINYPTLGAYILTDSVKGGNNCISVKKFNVYIGSSPSNITITNIGNVTDECAPQTYPFKITVDPNDTPGTLYIISTNDGTLSDTLINPLSSNPDTIYHTFQTSSCGFFAPNYMNSFFIRVNAKNFCGLVGKTSTIEPITLNSSPHSSFTGSNKGCIGQTVYYNSNSIIGSIVDPNTLFCDNSSIKYYWQIVPDTGWTLNSGTMGNISNYSGSQNTSFTFNSSGTYLIKLKTANANLSTCPDDSVFQQTICINPFAKAKFTISDSIFCKPDTVFALNSSTGGLCDSLQYRWRIKPITSYCYSSGNFFSFINGTDTTSKNPKILFKESGVYRLTLLAYNSCGSDTISKIITVKNKPKLNFSVPSSVCINSTICPANISDSNCYATNTLTYKWTSSNGTFANPFILNPGCVNATATNSQTITMSATNECGTDSVVKTVNISPIPIVTQKNNLEVCPGEIFIIGNFASNPTGATYTWTNSNTNIGKPASGSGNIANWTAPANNTGSNITATFTVTPTIGNCIGNPMTFTVTIKPKPVNNALSNVFACPQSTISTQLFTSTPSGANFSWTNTNTAIGIGSSGTGNINSWTAPNNSGSINITGTINITPTLNNCTGTTTSYTINIYPIPIANPKNNISVCSGDIINIGYFSSLPTGATFTWTNNNTNIGLAASGNGNIPNWNAPINNTGSNIVGTITVTPLLNSCTGTSTSFTITIKPKPSVDTIAPQTICSGQSTQTVVFGSNLSGTTYTWNSSVNGSLTPNPGSGTTSSIPATVFYNNNSTVSTITYTITPTANLCPGNQRSFDIVVNPAPIFTTQPVSSTVCVGGTPTQLAVVYANGTGTASYQWYSNSTSSTSGATAISGQTSATFSPTATVAGTTYYYCVITFVSSGGCPSITSNIVSVIVNPDPTISSQPTISQQICEGGNATALTINYTGGTGTATYQWYSNTSATNTGGTAIANTNSNSYNPPAFSTVGNYYYYATVTLGGSGCDATTSNTGLVTVVLDPIITSQPLASQSLCQNTTPNNLCVIVSGGVGTPSYQWYSNTSATASGGIAISGATSNCYNPPTTIVGTKYYYCVVTQSGSGCSVTSAVAEIVISPAPTFSTQPVSSTVCVGGTPTQLAVVYANGTGTASYQWYQNSVNSITGATAISGQTAATFSPTATVAGTTYYYCVITFASNGGCPSITSNIVSVVVNPDPSISSQPTISQQICEGGNANALTINYTGGTGTAIYQWYSNTSATNTGGTAIANTNSNSYTPPAFSSVGNYYYYATVTLSGSGCDDTTSNTALIDVVLDPIITSQPLASQSLCQNTTPNNLCVVVSGGVGTTSYQWYSNTSATASGGIALSGATTDCYTPTTATNGTIYYYCVVTQSGSGCSVTSAVAEVVISLAPTFTTQPISSTVCVGGTPTQLAVFYSNGTGAASYQWYSNSVSSTTGATAISGQTAATYSPPATAAGTTYYYCVITFASSGGCPSITSNIVSVIVNPDPSISSQPTISQQICEGGNANALNINYSGGTGTATYQWYSNTSATNTGGTAIANTNSNSYTPPAFSSVGNYYYYATVTLSGSGCDDTCSNTALIDVVLDPIITSQPMASQSLCQNTTPNNLCIVVSGGVGTTSYQWYSNTSATASGGIALSGATTDCYTPSTATNGTIYYYCVVTQSGSGCSVTSAVAEVVISPAPTFSSQPVSSTVCVGGTPTQLAGTYNNGTGTATYQWYQNSSNSTTGATAISGQTSASFSPTATVAGTTYYYCVITFATSGGCPSITSNIVSVIVNPDPSISSQPTISQQICEGGNANALNINYSGGTGTATYQWYSNTSATNTGGTAIANTNSNSYTPPAFSSVGNYYYYATVTLSGSGCDDTTSNTALIDVVLDPIITSQPMASQSLCQNTTPNNLCIVVSGGVGTTSYQWYSNTSATASGGIIITGATSDCYTPSTATVDTKYYYCIVTQSGSGCSVTSAVAEVVISQAPTFVIQPYASDTCQGFSFAPISVSYTNGTGAATYQWYQNSANSTTGATAINGQNTPTFTPPSITPGITYYFCEISFATSGGCPSIISNIVEKNLHPKPTASYTYTPTSGGHPLNVNFNNTSILNNSNQWIFGNNFPDLYIASPTISLTNTGIVDINYNVNLIVSTNEGCKDTVIHTITVHPLPIPNFYAANICKGDTTYFIDSSINTIGIINKWHWDFGNGDTSNIQNPHYLFSTANSYSVTLTITNDSNISNQITKIITVHPLPIPDFTTTFDTLGCVTPYGNIFTNTSTGASYYNWSFGDGNFSTTTSPTHIYSDTSYYWVRLIDTTQYGCIDSVKHRIHIIRPPEPLFNLSVSDSCGPLPVTFTNQSSGLYLSYLWNFDLGNPDTSILSGPFTKIYPTGINDSVFHVSLKATNVCGTKYHYDTIITFPKPKIFFTGILPDYICSNQMVTIIDSLRGNPDTLKVYFGDNSPTQIITFGYPFVNNLPLHHVYHYEGNNTDTTYILKFIAINDCGSDTTTDTIRVRTSALRVMFERDTMNLCINNPVHFTNKSIGGAFMFKWNFGDGSPLSYAFSPTHTYTSAGQFTVSLIGYNICLGDTLTDTIHSDIITIHPNPKPNFTFTDYPCSRTENAIFTRDPIACANGSNFQWIFGDASTPNPLVSNTNPISHTYLTNGNYNVTLRMTNAYNCYSDTSKLIHVLYTPKPNFAFSDSVGCHPLNDTIINLTDTIPACSHFWNLGNGNSSSFVQPFQQIYTNDNSILCIDTAYFITLWSSYLSTIPMGIKTCEDSLTKPLIVHPKPIANFSASDSCSFTYPKIVNFTSNSQCASNYQWLVNGNPFSNNNNSSYLFNNQGNYIISLINSNQYPSGQCFDTADFHYFIYPHWKDSVQISPVLGCEPLIVNINLNDTNVIYKTLFGDGQSSNLTQMIHTYQNYLTNINIDYYTIKIYVDGKKGCKDSVGFTDTIQVYPRAKAIFSYVHDSYPYPDLWRVIFTDLSENANIWDWNFGDGSTSNLQNPIHSYQRKDIYTTILVANNQFNCPSDTTITIELNELWGMQIPNAFQPGNFNYDVGNFKAYGEGLLEFRMEVYDTWGNKLWETTEITDKKPTGAWDGTKDGKPLPADTYVWKAYAKFVNGSTWTGMKQKDGTYKTYGTITLIR